MDVMCCEIALNSGIAFSGIIYGVSVLLSIDEFTVR